MQAAPSRARADQSQETPVNDQMAELVSRNLALVLEAASPEAKHQLADQMASGLVRWLNSSDNKYVLNRLFEAVVKGLLTEVVKERRESIKTLLSVELTERLPDAVNNLQKVAMTVATHAISDGLASVLSARVSGLLAQIDTLPDSRV